MTLPDDIPIEAKRIPPAPAPKRPDAPGVPTRALPDDSIPPEADAAPPGRFLAAVGRELWEPMSNMVSMTGFLLETELTRDQQEMVAALRESGDRVLRLVRDALDAVEVEAGLVQVAHIPFDLRVLADETVALLRGAALKRGKSIECRVHHEVPSRLVGDPGRLRQVLWNVARHGIETTPPGGVVVRVARLHEDVRSVTLRFNVVFHPAPPPGRPTAPGAPADDEAPVEGTALATEYTGLYLELGSRLAGVMGTRIAVEEEPGHGPRVWFDLAFQKQAEAPAEPVSAPRHAGLAGKRVLVVDPTEAIRRALAGRLEQWGCRVDEAAKAEEALPMVARAKQAGDPFRFVLVDRDLPLMSALEFGARLRARWRAEPLHTVMLAAIGRRGDLEDAQMSGFDAYLPKPIDWRDLADALVEIERMAAAGPSGDEFQLVTRYWLTETRRTRTRILIVEEDPVSVLVTDWTLRRIGYQVVRVSSASGMRELLAGDAAPFDLVVLALFLPDGDGLSLIHEIRAETAQDPATAFVALGYDSSRSERDRCRAEGFDAYIARPVDLAHLCEIVEQLTRTGLPAGPEAETLGRPGRDPHAGRARPDGDPDRVAVRFEVDATTGEVLEGTEAAKATMAILGADVDPAPPEDGPQAGTPVTPVEAPSPETDPGDAPEGSEQPPEALGPPLDLRRLDQVSLNNPTLRSGLLESYLREARAALALIGQAAGAGDLSRLIAESDRLSRVSRTLGAGGCERAFSSLCALGRRGSTSGAAPLLARALSELARVEEAAEALGGRESRPG